MRALIQRMLRGLSRRVLRRYHPQMIGITGSYGKTSAKEAISAVLATLYDVRSSAKSFNNELGVPFTVLGVPATGGAVRRVGRAFWNAAVLLLTRPSYPTMLVLEMGADKPNDIADLLKLTRIDVTVLTSVGPTHLQRFGSVEAVLEEKALLVRQVRQHGWAVLNADDHRVRALAEDVPARIVSYGFQSGVAVRCVDVGLGRDEAAEEYGLFLTVEVNRETVRVFLPGVVGRHSAYAALAALAVGTAFHLDTVDMIEGLRQYIPPPGRMRILSGVKQTTIIDDSYNSSPDACLAAIDALREFPADGLRYALLGDMADLGSSTEPAHQAVGREIVDEKIDVLVAVGEKMHAATAAAEAAGLDPDHIFHFDDPISAARFVQDRLKPGDVVLIKGSQVSRMEKATKELMAEPEKAEALLVRQDPRWLRR